MFAIIYKGRGRSATIGIGAALGMATAALGAAPPVDFADQLDLLEARTDAGIATQRGSFLGARAFVDSAATEIQKPKFSLNISVPVTYDWNASMLPSGGANTFEGNPDIRGGMSVNLTEVLVFSASLDASVDRFGHPGSLNGDALAGKARLQYSTGDADQDFQPFIGYSPKMGFAPTFGDETGFTEDLSVGFDKAWKYRINGERIPRENTGNRATVWELDLTGTVSRRKPKTGPSSWSAMMLPSVTYDILNHSDVDPNYSDADFHVNASLGVGITRKWVDAVNGVSVTAWTYNPIFTVDIAPPLTWFPGQNKMVRNDLRTSLGAPVIELQVAFVHGSKNPGTAYNEYTLGPSLKAAWRF